MYIFSGFLGKITQFFKAIFKIPSEFLKKLFGPGFKSLLGKPFGSITAIIDYLVSAIKKFENLNVNVVTQIIVISKEVVAQVVATLVEVGVLQGTTAEDFVNSLNAGITKTITLLFSFEAQFSASIVNFIEAIIDKSNIKTIINKIISLPFIKQLVALKKEIIVYIQTNFQAQIDDIKKFIQTQLEIHKDFFQPIIDGIAGRILIIINAISAFISGDVAKCPGDADPNQYPAGTLQWKLTIWLDQIKVKILEILGLKKQAEEVQEELDSEFSLIN